MLRAQEQRQYYLVTWRGQLIMPCHSFLQRAWLCLSMFIQYAKPLPLLYAHGAAASDPVAAAFSHLSVPRHKRTF